MSRKQQHEDGPEFAARLQKLRGKRRTYNKAWKERHKGRRALTDEERPRVLEKTGGTCHLCGGKIQEIAWHLDHVFPISPGGQDGPDNYLPAHALCNAYKLDNSSEDFQWLLKLGSWIRHEIEEGSRTGIAAAKAFTTPDEHRRGRRTPPRK